MCCTSTWPVNKQVLAFALFVRNSSHPVYDDCSMKKQPISTAVVLEFRELLKCVFKQTVFRFCMSKSFFGLFKEIYFFGLEMLLQSWTTQQQEGIFARWKWPRTSLVFTFCCMLNLCCDKVTSRGQRRPFVDCDPIHPLFLFKVFFQSEQNTKLV